MKGIRFYEEFSDKSKKNSKGTVFAADVRPFLSREWKYEGVGALFNEPNSVVCGSQASVDYVRVYCKRIEEAKARLIHPNLFVYLDQGE